MTLLCLLPKSSYTLACRSMSSLSALALAIAAAASSPAKPAFLWNSSRSLRWAYLRRKGKGGARQRLGVARRARDLGFLVESARAEGGDRKRRTHSRTL